MERLTATVDELRFAIWVQEMSLERLRKSLDELMRERDDAALAVRATRESTTRGEEQ